MTLLSIKNLQASVEDKNILKGVNLNIQPGEIHAIMGPNGSGKSTLANVLSGHPQYQVTKGEVLFDDKDLLNLSPNERSHEGLFTVFQSPRSIEGVNFQQFLHTIHKTHVLSAKKMTEKEAMKNREVRRKISLVHFKKAIKLKVPELKMPEQFLERDLNVGFSGGEKKKAEILQMNTLQPKLVILDELDSGLDVDALKICCQEVKKLQEQGVAVLMITHFTRIFKYLPPEFVHLFQNGNIQKTGEIELAQQIESDGYAEFCPNETPECEQVCK